MTATAAKPQAKRRTPEKRRADKARLHDEDEEDTPEKIAWFKQGILKHRAEFGWIVGE